MTRNPKLAAWAAGAGKPVGGNSHFASQYGMELKRVVRYAAEHAPRNVQTFLGPSELGAECDRQVVGKMAQGILADQHGTVRVADLATTNHVTDPWPSIVGTAVHAWFADAFVAENARLVQAGSPPRWLAEQRVVPDPRHPGTGDLYDAAWRLVGDHKVLGSTTLNKLKAHGPSQRYRVQLGLYGRGFRALGLPVDGVALLAWPRTGSSLDELYVWHSPLDAAYEALLDFVLADVDRRHDLARRVANSELTLAQIEPTPDDTECYFCPFYRPDADVSGIGCSGTKAV